MADGIDLGIEAKLRDIFDAIRREMPATLESAGHLIAAQASAAAPTPDEEYQTMMLGEGNPQGITRVPGRGSMNDGDHRMRFYKPDNDYLQPTIMEDVHPDGLSVGVGDTAVLDASSTYEWRNVNGETFTSTFPFWEAWEYGLGGSFFIVPRNRTNKKGKLTKLKPGIGHANYRYMMQKTIPRKRMYGGVDVDSVIENILLPAVRKVAKNA